jgi:hypothetical protein
MGLDGTRADVDSVAISLLKGRAAEPDLAHGRSGHAPGTLLPSRNSPAIICGWLGCQRQLTRMTAWLPPRSCAAGPEQIRVGAFVLARATVPARVHRRDQHLGSEPLTWRRAVISIPSVSILSQARGHRRQWAGPRWRPGRPPSPTTCCRFGLRIFRIPPACGHQPGDAVGASVMRDSRPVFAHPRRPPFAPDRSSACRRRR